MLDGVTSPRKRVETRETVVIRFAGRGTACARSTNATRSFPFPTRDKGLGSVS